VTVNVNVPAVVGKPSMEDGGDGQSKLMPGGSCPALIEYMYGATPPDREKFWL
jgi:hypothetical protein